ncbi:hypothetical protein BDV41DRAFT_585636 [Aspergillus transmontanensis]|uniref:HRQ family protein n=1 Tax=Aspergillus transmontanensis TaxID=1034304 RepID=A0A5N6W5X7_9EURO|nr:hypothetical protein BDV41DRAFT_585636 [Aspergillus transmontanensis]
MTKGDVNPLFRLLAFHSWESKSWHTTGDLVLLSALAFVAYVCFMNRKRLLAMFSRLGNPSARVCQTSLNAEKKILSSPEQELYKSVVPPSRRQTASPLLDAGAASSEETAPSTTEILQKHIPLDSNIKDLHGIFYSPTGFSNDDVICLGRFPDYATLSGVRLPEPQPDFNIHTAIAQPYRPIRWPYNQTMGELLPTITARQELYMRHGKAVLDYLPGSEHACRELMEMLLNDQSILRNDIIGTETDLRLIHPLHVLLNNVPEDFAILLRDPETGAYVLRAGIICSSLGWSLGLKLGKNIDGIHEPVPDYGEKLQFSMNRFFAKMPTDRLIQRGSWGIEIDQPVHMPPGDPIALRHETQDPDIALDRYHLRVDWQALRRLPVSAAMVFSFKVLFTPVTQFQNEPYIPSLFLKNYREAKPNLLKHKNIWHTEATILPALELWEREQKEQGIIPEDWQPATLDDYPYYPGWEERWNAT